MALKEVDPLTELQRYVAQYPTQTAAAAALGITKMYLTDLLLGRRGISETILEKLGLRETVVRKAAS
mgnify:CR=1 FL=1